MVTSPIASPVPRDLAMRTPGSFTGPRIVTFLLEALPAQLQALMRSSNLPPGAVHEGRLVEESMAPTRYLLELSVRLSDLEGDALLSSMMPDRMESPEWEVRSDANEES